MTSSSPTVPTLRRKSPLFSAEHALSGKQILALVLVLWSAWIAESFAMLILRSTPGLPFLAEAVLDSTILGALMWFPLRRLIITPLQKKAETEERRFIDFLMGMNPSAIVAATDRKGRITFANDKFCEITGYSRSQLIGQTHKIINSGHHSKEFFQELWRTISAGQVWHNEICNRRKDGTLYWVDSTIIPILDAKGVIAHFLSIRFDITSRKLAENALLHASKMAALGETAGCIAHEINNPLTVIIGKASQLERLIEEPGMDRERIRGNLETIQTTSFRIAKIVQGLKTLSRSDGQDPFQPMSTRQIIGDSVALCGEKFSSFQIPIQVITPEDIIVECRHTQISQVVLNLLNNAFDAIQSLPEKWVEIRVDTTTEGLLRISVTDSGPGVPEQVANRLMQPFFTTKEAGKGTGLGLSISLRIIEEHRGRLFLDRSCPNTRFVIELPIQPSR